MDTLEALRLFVSIAECGSLSAAARRESVATSTMTVALQQLEERAGASLITRSTRRQSFTHEGRQLLSDARRLLADWDAAITGAQAGPLRGPIRITAPQQFGRDELSPIVDRFLLAHPAVEASLHLTDQVVELVDQKIDVALRFGPLRDSGLKARPLLQVNWVVCAAPSYWLARGVPQRPDDLASHNCLVQLRPERVFASWSFVDGSQPVTVRVRGDRNSNDSETLRRWALAGHGILSRGGWGIRNELRSGALVTALDAYSVGRADLYAVTAAETPSRRVGAFVDFLADALQASEPLARPGP